MGFNPEAYLAKKESSGGTSFDPEAYLAKKEGQATPDNEPSFFGDFVPGVAKMVGGAALPGWGTDTMVSGGKEALGYLNDKNERYITAPIRAGVGQLQQSGDLLNPKEAMRLGLASTPAGMAAMAHGSMDAPGSWKAAWNQMGQDPRLAPTGKDIVDRGPLAKVVPDKNMSEIFPSLYTDEHGVGQKLFGMNAEKGSLADFNPRKILGFLADQGMNPENAALLHSPGAKAASTEEGFLSGLQEKAADKAGEMKDYWTLKALGAKKGQIDKLIKGQKLEPMVDMLHEQNAIPALGTRKDVYANVIDRMNEVGNKIGDALENSNVDTGMTGKDLAAQLSANSGIDELMTSDLNVSKANKIAYETTQSYLDNFFKAGKTGRKWRNLTAEDLWDLRKQLDKDLQSVWSGGKAMNDLAPAQQQLVRMRNTLGYMLTETMKDTAPELTQNFKEYSNLSRAKDIVEKEVAGKMALNPLGLSEMIGAGAGMAKGDPVQALESVMGIKGLREYGPSFMAKASKVAEDALTKDPEFAAQFAKKYGGPTGPGPKGPMGEAVSGLLNKGKGFLNDEEGSIGLPPRPGTENVYDLKQAREIKGEPKGLLRDEPADVIEHKPTWQNLTPGDRRLVDDFTKKVESGKPLEGREQEYLESIIRKVGGGRNENQELYELRDKALNTRQRHFINRDATDRGTVTTSIDQMAEKVKSGTNLTEGEFDYLKKLYHSADKNGDQELLQKTHNIMVSDWGIKPPESPTADVTSLNIEKKRGPKPTGEEEDNVIGFLTDPKADFPEHGIPVMKPGTRVTMPTKTGSRELETVGEYSHRDPEKGRVYWVKSPGGKDSSAIQISERDLFGEKYSDAFDKGNAKKDAIRKGMDDAHARYLADKSKEKGEKLLREEGANVTTLDTNNVEQPTSETIETDPKQRQQVGRNTTEPLTEEELNRSKGFKDARLATPSGNRWVTTIETKDGETYSGGGSTKEEARQAAMSNSAGDYASLKDLMDGKKKSNLVVGSNAFLRQRVPFSTLQQNDLHLIFHPQSGETWQVGLIGLDRTGKLAPKYTMGEAKNINEAIDQAINNMVAKDYVSRVSDTGEGLSSASDKYLDKVAPNWVYRQPKLSLRDVLELDPYGETDFLKEALTNKDQITPVPPIRRPSEPIERPVKKPPVKPDPKKPKGDK